MVEFGSRDARGGIMKVGFVGLGRMGQAMCRRLLDGGHDVTVYNRTADKTKPLVDLGAKPAGSIGDAGHFGPAVFTMLTDDAAVMDVVGQSGGLKETMPAGGIHICAGTHSVAATRALQELHKLAGQILIAAPVLGRPDVVASGNATIVVGGPSEKVHYCQPLFAAIAGRVVETGSDPTSAAAVKLANNFVLGCAIEAMGEGFALVRKYGVRPEIFYGVLADGLFACGAYKIYGKMISEGRYLPAGHRVVMGLKDAGLIFAAAEATGVPLPSGNVWRDRLLGAAAHGEGEHDWAVMARDQARASGIKAD
jgi:3-hydroxyisobutyrate dehydrogenase-like beta-hydroxyacid dehydrogenase